MIVKICGVRSLEDAGAAIDAGADMIGFNFYPPSPRYIEPAACARLVETLRASTARLPLLVGVFVNAPADEVQAVLDRCRLDLAQLHGEEPVEMLASLQGRAFKAIRPRSPETARAALATYCHFTDLAAGPDLLLDASAQGVYGGSGRVANWPAAATLASACRLLLAGGLNPENVAEAVAAVRPWGVDVASGVESAPGVKDVARMRSFVEQARTTTAGS